MCEFVYILYILYYIYILYIYIYIYISVLRIQKRRIYKHMYNILKNIYVLNLKLLK